MTIRSPTAFALSLLCLATSAGLGVLVHDAAVGMDAVQSAAPGDDVRFKGESTEPDVWDAVLRSWSFQDLTANLIVTGDGHPVIVLHPGEPIEDGTWIVEGVVRGHMEHGDQVLTIVDATAMTTPLLFA